MKLREPVPIFFATSRDGKLEINAEKTFSDYLRSLDGPVEVVVRRAGSRRSLAANRYYRGVVLTIFARHCGYELEELHELLKARYNSGESTKRLSSAEFAEFVENAIRLAAQMDCYIPPPHIVDI